MVSEVKSSWRWEKIQRLSSHLFHRQLLQLWQRTGQQSHQEGSGAAHDIQHGARQHGDERVLPGEWVQQGHHRMHAAGQGANYGRNKTKRSELPSHFHTIKRQGTHQTKLNRVYVSASRLR